MHVEKNWRSACRHGSWVALVAVITLTLSNVSAHAGLFGTGNSVQASFDFFDSTTQAQDTVGEPEVSPAIPLSLDTANPSNPPCTANTPSCIIYGPGNLLTISEGAIDLSTIELSNNQISIFNVAPGAKSPPLSPTPPFCSTNTTNCPTEVWAFDFKFAGNIDITSAKTDIASAADFLPTGSGLQLISPTEVKVNVTGDNPLDGDPLILDLQFATVTPTGVPEPTSLAILAAGLLGAGWLSRRKTQ